MASIENNYLDDIYDDGEQVAITDQIESEVLKLAKIKEEEQNSSWMNIAEQKKQLDLHRQNVNENAVLFRELLDNVCEKSENYKHDCDASDAWQEDTLKIKNTYMSIYQYVNKMMDAKWEAENLISENETYLKNYEAKIPDYKKEIYLLERRIGDEIKEKETSVAEEKNHLRKLEEEMQEVDKSLNEQKEVVENVDREFNAKLFVKIELSAQIQQEENVLKRVEDETQIIENDMKNVKQMTENEVSNCDKEISNLETEIVELNNRIEDENGEIQKLIQEQNCKADLITKRERFEKDKQILKQEYENKEKKLMELDENLTKAKKNFAATLIADEENLKELNEKIAVLVDENGVFENEVTIVHENISTLTADNEILKSQITTLKESILDITTNIKHLTADFDSAAEEAIELQAKVSSLSLEQEQLANAVQNSSKEQENRIAGIRANIRTAENEFASKQSEFIEKIKELSVAREEVENSIALMFSDKAKLAERKTKLSSLNAKKENQLAKLMQDSLERVQKLKNLKLYKSSCLMNRNRPASSENAGKFAHPLEKKKNSPPARHSLDFSSDSSIDGTAKLVPKSKRTKKN